MEGESQPNKLNRSLTVKELIVKANETKTDSAKAALSAYNDIMKEVKSLPVPPMEDSQIFATLVCKNREAIEKESGIGPFDNAQFVELLACKYFKPCNRYWCECNRYSCEKCRNHGINWVNMGDEFTHLIKTPKGIDFNLGSFDAKLGTAETKPTKAFARTRQNVKTEKDKTNTQQHKLALETCKKRNTQESLESSTNNSSKSRRISIEISQSPRNQNSSSESTDSDNNEDSSTTSEDSDDTSTTSESSNLEIEDQLQTKNGNSEAALCAGNLAEVSNVFCSMTESLLNKEYSLETKMYCALVWFSSLPNCCGYLPGAFFPASLKNLRRKPQPIWGV